MTDQDTFQRFIFEGIGVRGEIVHLDSSWQAVLERHGYPDIVRDQLGEALAAVVLLSGSIKFKGSLILQAQGEGPLHTLVAQATHTRSIRGLAHWKEEVPSGTLQEIFGEGRLVLTIQNEDNEPYQGIVGLEGRSLAEALQKYFALSEQLPTRLWLAADQDRAVGLFIQALPERGRDEDDWARISLLADTLSANELLHLPGDVLLYRLFHEEDVRLFETETVTFRCSCSRERIETMLRSLGQDEVEDILSEQGSVDVSCEYCNRQYRFDAVDARALFVERENSLPGGNTRH